jgi:hypothetical protein
MQICRAADAREPGRGKESEKTRLAVRSRSSGVSPHQPLTILSPIAFAPAPLTLVPKLLAWHDLQYASPSCSAQVVESSDFLNVRESKTGLASRFPLDSRGFRNKVKPREKRGKREDLPAGLAPEAHAVPRASGSENLLGVVDGLRAAGTLGRSSNHGELSMRSRIELAKKFSRLETGQRFSEPCVLSRGTRYRSVKHTRREEDVGSGVELRAAARSEMEIQTVDSDRRVAL